MAAKKRGASLADRMAARNKSAYQTGDAAMDSLLAREAGRRQVFGAAESAKRPAAPGSRTPASAMQAALEGIQRMFGKRKAK